MTREQYEQKLKKMGYQIEGDMTYFCTPYGVWTQQIACNYGGCGLRTVSNPLDDDRMPEYVLTDHGISNALDYLRECRAKAKEILDAGKDTADETHLPSITDIEADIAFTGYDEDGEYYNGWGVTDHYDSDRPICLKLGRDFAPAGSSMAYKKVPPGARRA